MLRGFDEERFAALLGGFTEEAREAVMLAREEAARLGHGQAGTGHLLLGLLRDGEGVAARALVSLGATLEETREQVENAGGRGEEGTLDRGPFTPRLVRVMELAPREASRVGHDEVGPGHLLLGLAREANSVAVRVLSALGASPADVRREVTRRFHNPSRPSLGHSARDPGSRERPARATLDYASRTKAVEDAPPMTFRERGGHSRSTSVAGLARRSEPCPRRCSWTSSTLTRREPPTTSRGW